MWQSTMHSTNYGTKHSETNFIILKKHELFVAWGYMLFLSYFQLILQTLEARKWA